MIRAFRGAFRATVVAFLPAITMGGWTSAAVELPFCRGFYTTGKTPAPVLFGRPPAPRAGVVSLPKVGRFTQAASFPYATRSLGGWPRAGLPLGFDPDRTALERTAAALKNRPAPGLDPQSKRSLVRTVFVAPDQSRVAVFTGGQEVLIYGAGLLDDGPPIRVAPGPGGALFTSPGLMAMSDGLIVLTEQSTADPRSAIAVLTVRRLQDPSKIVYTQSNEARSTSLLISPDEKRAYFGFGRWMTAVDLTTGTAQTVDGPSLWPAEFEVMKTALLMPDGRTVLVDFEGPKPRTGGNGPWSPYVAVLDFAAGLYSDAIPVTELARSGTTAPDVVVAVTAGAAGAVTLHAVPSAPRRGQRAAPVDLRLSSNWKPFPSWEEP